MAFGNFEGKDVSHPEVRSLFTREALLSSDWYEERLLVKQARDIELWRRHVRALSEFSAQPSHREEARRLGIAERLARAKAELERVSAAEYLIELQGTIGADPVHKSETAHVMPARSARELGRAQDLVN
jgi:hypothetical protein